MKRKLVFGGIILVCVIALFTYWRYNSRNYVKTIAVDTIYQETPKSLRVATYNIKTLNQGTDLKACQEDILSMDLDVVALQEVDQSAYRSNQLEMVKELANACGYEYYAFYESMWLIDGFYGIGLLSRYPIEKISSISLPNELFKEPRILANAKLIIGKERGSVYLTHLSFKERDVRKKQIAFINDLIKNEKNTILLGDFNTFTADDFFALDGYEAINHAENSFITFRDFGFPDNIYYSNDFSRIDAGTKATTFSDHNILWAELKWNMK